jgi:hypothetical protein
MTSDTQVRRVSAPFRRVWLFVPAALAALGAVWLAIFPPLQPSAPVLALGLLAVFLLPGFFAALMLDPSPRPFSLAHLPIYFVFSLAVWAIPATALQLLGANWFVFRAAFGLVLCALGVFAIARVWRSTGQAEPLTRKDVRAEFALAALCLAAAWLVAIGGRDADDWLYLQLTQQFIGSEPFAMVSASEARYSVRYAFHVWIFLHAYLGKWLGADVVALVRQVLPTLLTPLALTAAYGWAKTFFGTARSALLAVVAQLAIYVTFAGGDGWGRGFFERAAQDKFLVWLFVLPVALTFAWRFLQSGKLRDWLGYGATMVAGLWVHPISLFLVPLALGGFALLNSLSRIPLARRNWLLLALASAPALLSPIVIRATTLPAVFTVDTPEVQAYLRLSEGRLLLQPPFYLADPALVAHPALLVSLALLLLLTIRLRDDVRAQFLWGGTLVPLALLFNPVTARLLGEMLTPWQLWRMTWGLPAAFILVYVVSYRRVLPLNGWSPARISLAFILVASLAAGLADLNYGRSLVPIKNNQMLAQPEREVMELLSRTLKGPSNVLLPRELTRYAPAYTPNAVVMSNDAQKPEDARGKQIDRFYSRRADPKFLEAFLDFWEMDYVVTPVNSLQEEFIRAREGSAPVGSNTKFSVWKVLRQQ